MQLLGEIRTLSDFVTRESWKEVALFHQWLRVLPCQALEQHGSQHRPWLCHEDMEMLSSSAFRLPILPYKVFLAIYTAI